MKARFFRVKSFTDPQKTHIVTQLETGEWRCDCSYFNEKQIWMCDHIKKVRHIRFKGGRRKKKFICRTCGKKVSIEETGTMRSYNFEDCVDCRRKKERVIMRIVSMKKAAIREQIENENNRRHK